MSFSLFPPEINSALMFSGAGSGPLLEAGAAWNALAADLDSTATQYQTLITNLTTGPWLGPSSAQMAAATAPYIAWLQGTSASAAQTGAQAQVAAAAYQSAYASMVPLPEIAANRALLAELVANNFLGQNTGAIATTEANYLDMWIQDALTMDTYQVNSKAATTLPAQSAAPQVASGAMPAAAAAAAPADATSTMIEGCSGHCGPFRRTRRRGPTGFGRHQFGDLASGGGYCGSRESHGRAASGAGHLLHGHVEQHARTYVHELGRRSSGSSAAGAGMAGMQRLAAGQCRQVRRRQAGQRDERCGRPAGDLGVSIPRRWPEPSTWAGCRCPTPGTAWPRRWPARPQRYPTPASLPRP